VEGEVSFALEGGCLCGFVRYRAEGPASNETACHCSLCRRSSGAPFVAWFSVPAAGFRFTSGEPTCFASSDHATRRFCARCGTPLTFQSSRCPEEVDVTTCSLDDPERLPPRDHTHVASRLSWVRLADGLPTFSEARAGGADEAS
jgi:hypothetical protein